MNLVLHQFRKDARQFRILLGIWAGLLLLNLAVNLGWAGQVAYSPEHGFDHASNTWSGLLPTIIWFFVIGLPSLVVITDSPARREGFLATRPLPKRDLFLAKSLFILALIVAPLTLQETVHLVASGMPTWVVGRGTFERLMYVLPFAVCFGAYAALWSGHARWARALAVTVVSGYLVVVIVALLSQFVFRGQNFPPDANIAQRMAGSVVGMLALTGLAVWHSRAHRGVRVRWSGLAIVGVVYALTLMFWPWNPFGLKPEDPAAAASAMATTSLEFTPRSVHLQKVQDAGNSDQSRFDINLTPKIRSLPDRDLVQLTETDAKLVRPDGGMLRGGKIGPRSIFTGNYWNNSYNFSDFLAWLPDFPPDVLFRQINYYGASGLGSYLNFPRFRAPADHDQLTEPLTLQASFEAQVFQWRKIADLPLTPGATSTDEFGAWKFVATRSHAPTTTEFFFQRRQIELGTAANSRCSTTEYGPILRMSFMIYDPLRKVAWVPAAFSYNNVTRGEDTAVVQYYSVFSIDGRKAFTPEERARCRVIIYEKSWLGSVPETWQSSAFTLDEKLQPGIASRMGNQDPMPRAEFNHRIAALKTPAPDAPRREVSLYLLEFLRLVDAERFPLNLQDPCTRQLATFVPTHLDLFLDSLPVMDGAARESVINALKLGVTDAQKPAIIAGLAHNADLAGVLFARGWMEDARPEIYQLLQSTRTLPYPALQAIAWLQDPQTYPRLLEEFDARLTVETENLLRTLPGLDAQLNAIIARHWHEESLVFRQNTWQMFDDTFKLAMHDGQVSALQRVYLFLDDPDFDSLNIGYPLAEALRETILIPDVKLEDRQQNDFIFTWLRRHRPEDFIFNPALRQFVLKATLPAFQTASASQP